jgi:hypothetical protein
VHLLGLIVHHFVHSFVSAIQTVVDVLGIYVSSAAKFVKRQCSRRRTLGACQLPVVIPSCDALLCDATETPTWNEVEKTQRDDFGDLVVMTNYLNSQLQCIAASRILGVIL